jgi:hypothetical protein
MHCVLDSLLALGLSTPSRLCSTFLPFFIEPSTTQTQGHLLGLDASRDNLAETPGSSLCSCDRAVLYNKNQNNRSRTCHFRHNFWQVNVVGVLCSIAEVVRAATLLYRVQLCTDSRKSFLKFSGVSSADFGEFCTLLSGCGPINCFDTPSGILLAKMLTPQYEAVVTTGICNLTLPYCFTRQCGRMGVGGKWVWAVNRCVR